MAQNRLKLGILGVQKISHELRGTFSYNHMQGGYSCKESEFLLRKWPSSPRRNPALLSSEIAFVKSFGAFFAAAPPSKKCVARTREQVRRKKTLGPFGPQSLFSTNNRSIQRPSESSDMGSIPYEPLRWIPGNVPTDVSDPRGMIYDHWEVW